MKRPPRDIFGEHVRCPNYFRFRLGPDVVIAIGMRVKEPGLETPGTGVTGVVPIGRGTELVAVEDQSRAPLTYERLLDDAMDGEQMLFARWDEIEAQWRVVDPVLGDATPLHFYDRGTWGPSEAERLPLGCPIPGKR